MAESDDFEAWNNFVMSSQPDDYPAGSDKRAAAIAKNYMNESLSGGINSFLTNNWELGGDEVLRSLQHVGAAAAAKQFSEVLNRIGQPILSSTQEQRWDLLEKHWPKNADDAFDFLSDQSERSIMFALEKHVQEDERFYRNLK
jgi:hypothetical protein